MQSVMYGKNAKQKPQIRETHDKSKIFINPVFISVLNISRHVSENLG